MKRMKYIITAQDNKKEEIFIFPCEVNHDCMAEMIARIRDKMHGDWRRINRTPVSAGFIEGGECVGESETLRLKSRPQDSSFLK